MLLFGEFEGLAWKPVGAQHHDGQFVAPPTDVLQRFKDVSKQVKNHLDVPYPGKGGESTRDVQTRTLRALDDLLKKADRKNSQHVAIVSHGRTNKILIGALMEKTHDNNTTEEEEDDDDTKQTQRHHEYIPPMIKQSNTCINVLDVNMKTGQWTVQCLNYIDHVKDNVIER